MGSLPDFLPGYQGLDNADAKRKFEARWRASLPTGAGLSALEMMARAKEGKIKAMLIVGENPVSSFPCPSLVREGEDTSPGVRGDLRAVERLVCEPHETHEGAEPVARQLLLRNNKPLTADRLVHHATGLL